MIHQHVGGHSDAEILDIVREAHAHLKAKEFRTILLRVTKEGGEIFEGDAFPQMPGEKYLQTLLHGVRFSRCRLGIFLSMLELRVAI